MSLTTTEEKITQMGLYTGGGLYSGGFIHGRKIALVIWGAYTRGGGGGGLFTEFYGIVSQVKV